MSKEECRIPAMGDDEIKIGEFRVQKDYDEDEFHIHHDDKSLKFVFGPAKVGDVEIGGIRRWELAWDQFRHAQHDFKEGQSVLFQGGKVKGSKEKACDLVFARKGNKWKITLHRRGRHVADAVMGDEILTALDEWMQRH